MQDELFTVKYIALKTCFVYLPNHWLRKLSSRPNVVKVQHNEANYYLSWYSRPGPDDSCLCLCATFARTLNIKEGDEVFVSCCEEAPPLTSLVVAPKTSQDREIVELQSENIQSNLLNQITVVAKNQTIVAWVSQFLPVMLIVKSLNPQFKYGRLEELTEIHVGDAPAKSTPPKSTPTEPLTTIIDGILTNSPSRPNVCQGIYRVHPLPISRSTMFIPKCAADEALNSPFRVYASQSLLCGDENAIYRLRKARQDRQHLKSGAVKLSKKTNVHMDFTVLLSPLQDYIDKFSKEINKTYFTKFTRHPCIYMTEELMNDLRVKTGGKVILEPIDEFNKCNVECTSVEIFPREKFISPDIFRNYVTRNSRYEKMLLNSHGTVTFEDGTRCLVKLLPENCMYSFFDETALKNKEIKISDAENIEDSRSVEEISEDVDVPIKSVAIDILQTLIAECKSVLTLSLGLHNIADFHYDRENILISGTTGSGKTIICKLLREILSQPPYFTHTRFIDCKSLKGKKVEVMLKLLTTEICHAVYHQPSILFFDDIDYITSASSNTEEVTPDSTNALRITDAILKIIKQLEHQACNYISVVATCTDINKVGKRLREARGVHFFRTILRIPNLEKEDRIKILKSSLQDKLYVSKEIDWDHYGNKTEGWVAQDLVVLADKAAFTAWKRHVKDKSQGLPMLRDFDLSETLSRCTPQSLHGVNLYKGAGHSWSNIGGLNHVKLALVEILHWPLKYPGIFKSAPIKLQSGILLYGMPGTGKTMLAGAIARECGLNLINVKGPELLSKYIGASEEAVRNVFEKAQRAKPCVLFFDEFDSLAPRRGHDSTGVTDRVVNQLLTHLDGIEGREGVAVVAATSRPDMLDPALLRPGRLDKSLLCPLPDEDDREEILRALCLSHEIETENLDLSAIANLTSGYTGADLNAILMQARLKVIEEALEHSSKENQQNYNHKNITQEDLIKSFNSTKPSLLAKEKEKYNRIYAKFAKSESYPVDELKHQKATLA